MKKPSVPLGLVFSRSGPYAMMAGEMRKSALMAIDEVNRSDEFDFTFTPHLRDPGGVVAAYHTACDDLLREEQVDHIVGCYTSASRRCGICWIKSPATCSVSGPTMSGPGRPTGSFVKS